MRDLHENPGSVSRVGLATTGAAMVEVNEHAQTLLDDFVGLASLDINHETDATGVMLEPRIVKALFRW